MKIPFPDAAKRFLAFAWTRWSDREMSLRATGLAFAVVFATVPLFGLGLAVASAFPAVKESLLSAKGYFAGIFLPGALAQAGEHFDSFADGAKNLSVFGLAAALASAVMLTFQLEEAVRACWQSNPKIANPPKERLLLHWAILTAGPILATVLLSGSSALAAKAGLADSAAFGAGSACAYLAAFGALFALNKACPVDPPAHRPALAASLASLAALCLLRYGFALWWDNGTSYGTLYGAFSIVAAFPLWVWLTWLAVLVPASLAGSFLAFRSESCGLSCQAQAALTFKSLCQSCAAGKTLPRASAPFGSAHLEELRRLGLAGQCTDGSYFRLGKEDAGAYALLRNAFGPACGPADRGALAKAGLGPDVLAALGCPPDAEGAGPSS